MEMQRNTESNQSKDKEWRKKGALNEIIKKKIADAKENGRKWVVAASEDLPNGGRLIIDIEEHQIGVFRVKDKLYAYYNICAHMGGPVCQGLMVPRVLDMINDKKELHGQNFDEDDPHIACTWHGFEYSIVTGKHASIERISLIPVPVEEKGGIIYVTA